MGNTEDKQETNQATTSKNQNSEKEPEITIKTSLNNDGAPVVPGNKNKEQEEINVNKNTASKGSAEPNNEQ